MRDAALRLLCFQVLISAQRIQRASARVKKHEGAQQVLPPRLKKRSAPAVLPPSAPNPSLSLQRRDSGWNAGRRMTQHSCSLPCPQQLEVLPLGCMGVRDWFPVPKVADVFPFLLRDSLRHCNQRGGVCVGLREWHSGVPQVASSVLRVKPEAQQSSGCLFG